MGAGVAGSSAGERAKAAWPSCLSTGADVLEQPQELDDTEHRLIPFIEKFPSINEAVTQFGRI